MQTKGLVSCAALALPLFFVASAMADDLATPVIQEVGVVVSAQPVSAPPVSAASASVDVVMNDCDSCCDQPFWFAATEILFLDVQARTGGRVTASFNDNTTVGTEIAFNTGTGFFDNTAAPRLTVGRQFGANWAVAARYFDLGDSTTFFPRLVPGTTPLPTFGTYTEIDQVKMQTLDVEAIRSFYPGATKVDVSFGARHAALDVDSLFHAFGVITTGNFANLLLSNGCAFDGTGPTSQVTIRRQVGDSPVYLFIGGRASQLWGHTDSFGRSAGTVASSPSAPLVGAATVTRNNAESELLIAELQVGAQFEYELQCIPAKAFFRVACEYQDWNISGPPTGGAGFGGTIGDLTTNSFSAAGLGDSQLFGASFATGLTW